VRENQPFDRAMELLIAVIVACLALAAAACWLICHVFFSWQKGLDREARRASVMDRMRATWRQFSRAGIGDVSRRAENRDRQGNDI
jgi:hypothetical protein